MFQQSQQAIDLCIGERFKAVIVQFNADAGTIHVSNIAPLTCARVPGAQVIVEHVMYGAVPAYYVMSAHLRPGQGKRLQRGVAGRLCSMMNDHKIGLAHSEICGANPFAGHHGAVNIVGLFGQFFCKGFCLLFVTAVAGCIFSGGAATVADREKQESR